MWKREKTQTASQVVLSPHIEATSQEQSAAAELIRVQAPSNLIPIFMRKASEEIPWHPTEKIDARDIERALRAVREHFERTYPDGNTIDWMGLSENCKLRLHFAVLDHFDFSCPTLSHLVLSRETTRQELIELFTRAADIAEERQKQRQDRFDSAQRQASRGMNYGVVTPIA